MTLHGVYYVLKCGELHCIFVFWISLMYSCINILWWIYLFFKVIKEQYYFFHTRKSAIMWPSHKGVRKFMPLLFTGQILYSVQLLNCNQEGDFVSWGLCMNNVHCMNYINFLSLRNIKYQCWEDYVAGSLQSCYP